jgi:dihydroorotase
MSRALELDRAAVPAATVLIRGARVLDPRTALDGRADLLVRDGVLAEIGDALEAPQGAELVDGEGLHALPAFVDPHVHLRTPGREDEEDLDSGTRAAAAGGFCAILAQPNTDPVVDTAPVLRSLRERARASARIPTGFLAAITVGQRGEQLTEMAELAGCSRFTRRTPPSPAKAPCTRARCPPCSGWPASRRSRSRPRWRATARSPRTSRAASTFSTCPRSRPSR